MSATFCAGSVETIWLTDQGSDTDVVSPEVFNIIKKAKSTLNERQVNPPVTYRSVARDVFVTCKPAFKVDIKLRIGHGTTLILRSVDKLFAEKSDGKAIIGRPLLHAVGCNNADMLAAAANRNAGVLMPRTSAKTTRP